MLNYLIEWSLRNRFIVVLAALLLAVFGSMACMHTSLDVLPEFAPPQIILQTEAPGMVAEEVETLVSLPLESVLNGTPGVTLVKSISMPGISNITVIFNYGEDIYRARQMVNERIQVVMSRLPQSTGPPTMLPVMSVVGDVLKIGITSDKTTPMELRTLADWDIRNRILSVSGVSRVLVMGGDQKQYQVLVRPEKLKALNVTLGQVQAAVEQANVAAPGGFLVTPDQQLSIRGMSRTTTVDELANSVITTREGVPVLLKHVANVQIGSAFKYGDAVVNGKPGVEMIVSKQPWVDTLDVTRRVEAALDQVRTTLPPDIHVFYIFRQADFIERSIGNMVQAIVTGGVLVVLILLIFLLNWRTSLISLTAIPLSLLSAVLFIKSSGGSINAMTLGGLAIAVGEVVDDAIVDVENVYRRLRENRLRSDPKPILLAVYDACREVRSSVVYATFIVAMVFLPVFTLPGVEGRIFTPLGVSYIVATLSSLLVALTVTPALCMYLLGSAKNISEHEPRTVQNSKRMYSGTLRNVLAHPGKIFGAALVAFIASLSLLPFMGQAFLPEFKENNLIIAATGLPGQSLEATTRMGIAIERKLLEHKEVIAVGQRAGRAELDDDAGGPNFSEFDVKLTDNRSLSVLLADIRRHLQELPGVAFDIGSFISHRMDDVLSGGTRADIVIKIFGPDLGELRKLAVQVSTILKTVPGAVDVRPEAQLLAPEIRVKIDRAAASRFGLTSYELSQAMETAFNGRVVSQVVDGQKVFGLKVWLDEQYRHNLEQIRNTLIDTPTGARIPLAELASIQEIEGPNAIIRENVARRIVVQGNVSGRDIVSIVREAQQKITNQVVLPQGYYVEYSGQYEAQRVASQRLAMMSMLAFLGILVLLHKGLSSWKLTFLVLSNVPLAAIGGIIAVAISGNVISIGSLIGFISLFGISTRNSILLVGHINDLLQTGVPFDDAIFRGSLDRLAPVLMTATTTALGMLPLAVLGGPGRELEQPLAVVIIGGLVSSTILTLIVIPALFKLFLRPPKVGPAELADHSFNIA
jgi:nickel/cobalt tolerance cation efflux system protein